MLNETQCVFQLNFQRRGAQESKLEQGQLKFSHRATISALLINLYRDEPLLRQPFTFLQKLIDMDELFTTWRNRHAQMVLRTLGTKDWNRGLLRI